ncbi:MULTISPECIES: hypothetical protein [Corynebacterium]|uniref:hypothetical protein n=1 Tax=Corynebacterium TaxID=1716 RepID=UPI00124D405E|nr:MULTISPECIES: hypothetical protein [Corynebacterium]
MNISMRIGLDMDSPTVADLIEFADTLRTLGVDPEEYLVIDEDTREIYVEHNGVPGAPSAASAAEDVVDAEEVEDAEPAAATPPTGDEGEDRIEFPRGTSFDAGKVYDAVRQTLGDQAVHSVVDALLRGRGGPSPR